MLVFKEPTIEDREAALACAAHYQYPLCDHCFTDLFIWQGHYRTQICFYKGFLLVKANPTGDRDIYLAPMGDGDLREAIELLRDDAAACGVPFALHSVPEGMIERIEAVMPGTFEFSWSEDSADYIYLREKLETLSGKKLQSKRNMVNRFLAAYEGRWSYDEITEETIREVFDFHLKWCEENGHSFDPDILGESCAISRALKFLKPLDMRGGMLRLDGQIIAFSLGSRATDEVFVVQIEKADHNIPGAYQMINQQFVLHNCMDVTYVNREEDLGLEGLRKAKQSYHPAFMGKKYQAVPR